MGKENDTISNGPIIGTSTPWISRLANRVCANIAVGCIPCREAAFRRRKAGSRKKQARQDLRLKKRRNTTRPLVPIHSRQEMHQRGSSCSMQVQIISPLRSSVRTHILFQSLSCAVVEGTPCQLESWGWPRPPSPKSPSRSSLLPTTVTTRS